MTKTNTLQLIKDLHAVPGLKDADIHDLNRTAHKIVRTTTVTTDLDRLLKNAKRQARRRKARLDARLAEQGIDPTVPFSPLSEDSLDDMD